eukprot:1085823-Amorphochlora_amoeboformis.AAC.1
MPANTKTVNETIQTQRRTETQTHTTRNENRTERKKSLEINREDRFGSGMTLCSTGSEGLHRRSCPSPTRCLS